MKRLKDILKRCEAAAKAYSIDLYRTLNQSLEKRIAFEEFIAHARTDIPWLIEQVKLRDRALQKAIDNLTWIDNEAAKGDCWKNGENGTSVLTLKEVAKQTLAEIKEILREKK